jgi:hypothetical protein
MAPTRKLAALLAAVLLAGLVAVGCGGSSGSEGASGSEGDDVTTTAPDDGEGGGSDEGDEAEDPDTPVSSDGDEGDASGDAGAVDGSDGDSSEPDEGTGTTIPGSVVDPDADEDLPAPIAMVDAQTLTGLTLEEADLKAGDFGWTLRVARLDGEDLALTEDYSPSRVNVEVADDVVTDIVSIG